MKKEIKQVKACKLTEVDAASASAVIRCIPTVEVRRAAGSWLVRVPVPLAVSSLVRTPDPVIRPEVRTTPSIRSRGSIGHIVGSAFVPPPVPGVVPVVVIAVPSTVEVD